MSEIRLVALDLDGTVFNDEKQISPRTLKAIRAALDKGVDVLPATGRTVDGVPRQFLEISGVRYALTSTRRLGGGPADGGTAGQPDL